MSLATPIIDLNNKNFFKKLENLKKELGMKEISKENMKQVRNLEQKDLKDLEDKKFLLSFLNQMKNTKDKGLREMLDCLELKRLFIGDFGRRAGYVYRNIEEPYFRFVIHLGSPEIYYKGTNEQNDPEKDKQIPMLNGYGLVISPQESRTTKLTVYPDPIRLVNDHKVQQLVSKIRPKDYKRTVLIYDFQYNLPESFLKEMIDIEEKENDNEQEENDNEQEENDN